MITTCTLKTLFAWFNDEHLYFKQYIRFDNKKKKKGGGIWKECLSYSQLFDTKQSLGNRKE
jgi:hypothetical protein